MQDFMHMRPVQNSNTPVLNRGRCSGWSGSCVRHSRTWCDCYHVKRTLDPLFLQWLGPIREAAFCTPQAPSVAMLQALAYSKGPHPYFFLFFVGTMVPPVYFQTDFHVGCDQDTGAVWSGRLKFWACPIYADPGGSWPPDHDKGKNITRSWLWSRQPLPLEYLGSASCASGIRSISTANRPYPALDPNYHVSPQGVLVTIYHTLCIITWAYLCANICITAAIRKKSQEANPLLQPAALTVSKYMQLWILKISVKMFGILSFILRLRRGNMRYCSLTRGL